MRPLIDDNTKAIFCRIIENLRSNVFNIAAFAEKAYRLKAKPKIRTYRVLVKDQDILLQRQKRGGTWVAIDTNYDTLGMLEGIKWHDAQ